MTPEEEPSKSEAPASPAKRLPARRSRRGGRGRRRPGPPRIPAGAAPTSEVTDAGEVVSAQEPYTSDAPLPDSEIEEARHSAGDAAAMEEREARDEYREPQPPHEEEPPPLPERRDFRPASPASVTEAIEEVNRVMTSLRQVLDTMEEILETLELAEVQKNADEREIQSLKNALRQMDRRGPEPRRESQPHEAQPHAHQPREPRDPRRHGRR